MHLGTSEARLQLSESIEEFEDLFSLWKLEPVQNFLVPVFDFTIVVALVKIHFEGDVHRWLAYHHALDKEIDLSLVHTSLDHGI